MKDTRGKATETELVRRAQAGDTNAFASLVTAHQRFVYNLALHSLGDPREAEDVAQEALIRAWLALPRFRRQSQFRTWLYRIVTNLCYTRLPQLRREFEALSQDEMGDQVQEMPANMDGDPGAHLEASERRAFLHRQIDALPESYRLVVLLRYQEDLSYEEIANVLDLPLGTVKIGLFRARQRLREAWQAYERGQSMAVSRERSRECV